MFFIGIDEAGYGPILGPLVIGGVMLRCACEPDPRILWKGLSDAVAPKPRKREPRLVVCDSKMLSNRPDGLVLLEKAALVAARLAGLPTDGWRELVTGLDPDVAEHLAACPWYEGDLPLPHACEAGAVGIQANAVRGAGVRCQCQVEAVAASILPAVRYNSLLRRCDNKGVVLWMATTWVLARLLRTAAARGPCEPVYAVLDRQGGRTDYRPALQRSFEPLDLAELHRSHECSRYRMVLPMLSADAHPASDPGPAAPQATGDWREDAPGPEPSAPPAVGARREPTPRPAGQVVELAFMQDADQQCGPTAWASCVAKYAREVCMARLNSWWCKRVAGLEPTAGYLPDGRRFAEQVAPHFERLRVRPETVIRER